MAYRREARIQSEILGYLGSIPKSFWFKAQLTNAGGVPDICGTYRGLSVYFEVKRPGEMPRKLQKHRHDQIENAGGFAFVVRSLRDTQECMKTLDQYIIQKGL